MYYKNEEQFSRMTKYIEQVYNSNRWSNGEFTKKVAETIREKILHGRPMIVFPTTNGTQALWIAHRLRTGCVLIPELAAPAVWMGAEGRMLEGYDIEYRWQPNIGRIFSMERTTELGSVVVVHTGGVMVQDIRLIQDWAYGQNALLIEDISHAQMNETWNGDKAGMFGDVVVGSLYATKAVSTGEGGFIAIDPHVVDSNFVYELWNAGRDVKEIQNKVSGCTNARPSEFQAAVMYAILEDLEDEVSLRIKNGLEYDGLLKQSVDVPIRLHGDYSTFYKYPVLGTCDEIEELEDRLPKAALTGKIHSKYMNGDEVKYGEDSLSKRHLCLNIFYEDKESVADEVNRMFGG